MKYLRRGLAAFGLLLLAIVLLVWFLPANWVMPWLQPQMRGVQLHDVHGLLWDGRAGEVSTADGTRLGKLHWRLSRRLLLGDLRMQIDLHGPQIDFSGALHRLPQDRLEWRAVRARVNLAIVPVNTSLTLGQPQGELSATIDHAELQGGWPLQLGADIRWENAGLQTETETVPLGNLHARVTANGGVISAEAEDDGQGPLQLRGRLDASPLGYRLDASLGDRSGNPALRRWLARLGTPDADGTIQLHNTGGLAGTLPTATAPPSQEPHVP